MDNTWERQIRDIASSEGWIHARPDTIIKVINDLLKTQKEEIVGEIREIPIDEKLINAEGLMDDETYASKLVEVVRKNTITEVITRLTREI